MPPSDATPATWSGYVLLVMKQGGETWEMASDHLLAHLRLDPRYAPLLPALEKNGHA